MDNLSHTLAGMIAAETASERFQATASKRALFFTTSILANNFPDLDLVYSDALPAPLGYLLHHRGHTHTLGGALLQILLILGALFIVTSFRRELKDKTTLKGTTAVAAIGLLLHLMMDGWNSYGVHPLWPISGKWFYGDAVFILEPFVWLSFAVPLMFLLKTKIVRGGIGLILCVAPLAAWRMGILSGASILMIFTYAAALFGLAQHFRPRSSRLILAVFGVISFVLVQMGASAAMHKQVAENFQPDTASHRMLAVITNPSPANPFCWQVIRIEADPDRDAWKIVSFADSLLDATWAERICPTERPDRLTAEGTLTDFRNAYTQDCQVEAWLRFARAPWIQKDRAVDVRFATSMRGNFTELPGAGTVRTCPWTIPGWDHPRQDLIDLAMATEATK